MKTKKWYEEQILMNLHSIVQIEYTQDLKSLHEWQNKRLLSTHSHLYKQPKFKPAMDFFKDDIYGGDKFNQRNEQLIKAVPLMCTTMPRSILDIIHQAIDLNALSLGLDINLMAQLPSPRNIEQLSLEQWVSAYQQSSTYEERKRQIDLIETLGVNLAKEVKKPMIRPLLSWGRIPATAAGYENIHLFICRGFDAFQPIKNINDFLIPLLQTERDLLTQWFAKT